MQNLVQNEIKNTLEQSKAFRGRANHAIYPNLFLVTVVLLGARIVIIRGKAISCYIRRMQVIYPLPMYIVAGMTPRWQPS